MIIVINKLHINQFLEL